MYITLSDLAPFATIEAAKAAAMIEDAEAQAMLAAPCLSDPAALSDAQRAAVRAVLRSAILRWNESGSGALQQVSVGSLAQTMDTRQQRRALFWPSEVVDLERVCAAVTGATGSAKAWSVDLAGSGGRHVPWCDVCLGGVGCSCGADIAGRPIYECGGDWL